MSGNVTNLKPKQEEAIAALLTNRTVDDSARAVKITPRTLYRWLREADFDAAYRQARRAAFGQCVARLQQASSAAVSVMLKILADPAAPASARLRAADMVVTHSAKAIEIEDVEARVSALEASVAAERAGGRR
jgi:AcrR family transcriptional regulator